MRRCSPWRGSCRGATEGEGASVAEGALTSSVTSPSGPSGHLPLQGEDLWVRARALTRQAAELMER
ncbi:hypothetical protein DDF67_25210, partial [Caulobacter endophyticus]